MSGLNLPVDPAVVRDVLAGLCGWLGEVYLRYPDAAASLPDCWLWHPDVVEELLWLQHAWHAAYRDEAATVSLAGDWHDRQRPGVVRRIKTAAGACSLDNHPPHHGRHDARTVVPLADAAAELIADWWATHRDQPPPEPGPEHHAAAHRLEVRR